MIKVALFLSSSVLALLFLIEAGWSIYRHHPLGAVTQGRLLPEWDTSALSVLDVQKELGGDPNFLRVGLPGKKPKQKSQWVPRTKDGFNNVDFFDPTLGKYTLWRLPPNLRWESTTRRKDTGAILYSVSQSTDSFGRRRTVQPAPRNTSDAIVTLGCSFGFGSGVKDEETLASHLGRALGIETQNLSTNGAILPWGSGESRTSTSRKCFRTRRS